MSDKSSILIIGVAGTVGSEVLKYVRVRFQRAYIIVSFVDFHASQYFWAG
ncbi:MAG: hypothetical protein ACI910_000290 [Oleispira sp.]|jgi:hypothetical protein